MSTESAHIEVSQSTGAQPPIIFESGLGRVIATWSAVIRAIQKTNATLAYDRPGIGQSHPTDRSRDGDTIVEDLRALLARRLNAPYLLVGHSSGGLYLQLFARRHPQLVAGLILVDSTHPAQFEGYGARDAQDFSATVLAANERFATMKREFDALTETGRQVLAMPPLPSNIPAMILTAPDRSESHSAAFNNAKRADFAQLYPHAEYREIDCGHDIPVERPDAVADAIRIVLARTAVRS